MPLPSDAMDILLRRDELILAPIDVKLDRELLVASFPHTDLETENKMCAVCLSALTYFHNDFIPSRSIVISISIVM